jgi:hypothetical protein
MSRIEPEKYRVCDQRNIAAAYGRFFGRDSGSQFAASQVRTSTLAGLVTRLRPLFPRRLTGFFSRP